MINDWTPERPPFHNGRAPLGPRLLVPEANVEIMKSYNLTHLQDLEAESIYVFREVAAQFERPVLLFWPARIPFPLMHIDTGHNFPETLEYRDRWVDFIGAKLIVRSVEDSIRQGRVAEEKGPNASRNVLQTVTLLDALAEFKFDAAIGGGRRDEEKARAKERFFSHRDEFGQWDPKNQRPELWSLFNGGKNIGEHFRVFPISNWTEMDIWQYILHEKIEMPNLYFTHERPCLERDGILLAKSDYLVLKPEEKYTSRRIRFRTIGDMTCTGAVLSEAAGLEEIIVEVAASRVTERGTRADDRRSDAAMEDRKKEGYF